MPECSVASVSDALYRVVDTARGPIPIYQAFRRAQLKVQCTITDLQVALLALKGQGKITITDDLRLKTR